MDPDYTVVEATYGDPLRRAKGLGPYQRFPERSSWEEWELRRYRDGTSRRFKREAERWAGSFSNGPWTEMPLDTRVPPPTFKER